MRKLLLATLEYPPTRGGVAEYLYGLVSALPHERVTVLAHGDGQDAPPSMAKVVYRRLLPRFRLPLGWLKALPPVIGTMRREKSEVLAISHLLPMGYIALILKRLRRTPYVVFVHGTDLNYASRSAWKRHWTRRILAAADLVVANSRYTSGLAERAGADPARIEIVYPCPAVGHVAHRDMAESKHDFGLIAARRTLLSVGRLVRRKGFDRVLRALAQLRHACGDVVYMIVGDGPEREALEREAARLGLKSSVIFLHDVPRGKLNEYFSAADLFVLPAREVEGDVEGFGMALIEAGFHATPVVTTKVGGISEAVIDGETGLVLPADVSDGQLADSLCRLMLDRAGLARMGANGLKRVRETFNWPTQAETLLKRLETL